MKLIDGKFYDEKGNQVPLEIGNPEQIKLLNQEFQRQEELELLETKGIEADLHIEEIHYVVATSIICSCGKRLRVKAEVEADDEDDALEETLDYLEGSTEECFCGISYTLKRNDNNSLIFFKNK